MTGKLRNFFELNLPQGVRRKEDAIRKPSAASMTVYPSFLTQFLLSSRCRERPLCRPPCCCRGSAVKRQVEQGKNEAVPPRNLFASSLLALKGKKVPKSIASLLTKIGGTGRTKMPPGIFSTAC